MATYKITDPNGETHVVDGPAGLTRDEVIAKIKAANQGPGVLDYAKKTVEPLTRYPATEAQFAQEGWQQMGRGVDQLASGQLGEMAKGAGNLALGGYNWAGAPIFAGLRTIAGEPTSEAVRGFGGSERVARAAGAGAEFAGSFAIPIPNGTPRRMPHETPSVEALKDAAEAGFQSPDVKGFAIRPKALSDWSNNLRAHLTEQGIDANLAPKTWGIIKSLQDAPAGFTATGNNLQSLRRTFANAAMSPDPTERMAASEAIEALDSFVPEIPRGDVISGSPKAAADAWADARGNYAAAKRSERVTQAAGQGGARMSNAELQAAGAHSGQNIDNATRQKIKSILLNPKARRGFNDEELKAMENIVKGSFTGNAARFSGNVLGGGGGWGLAATGMGGALVGEAAHPGMGGIIGAGLPAVGYGIKKIGNRITAKSIEALDKKIRERSPLAGHTESIANGFQQAAQNFEQSKTPQNMARLMIASHAMLVALTGEGEDTDETKAARRAYYGPKTLNLSGMQSPLDQLVASSNAGESGNKVYVTPDWQRLNAQGGSR